MKNWFLAFKKTRYLTTTAILTACLFTLSLTTAFLKFGDSAFQVADGAYLALICVVPGPMMLVVGLVYPLFFDLVNGGFIFIPLSLLVHVLIFFLVKLLQKPLTNYGAIWVGELVIFLYLAYLYCLSLNLGQETAQAVVWKELIVDSIQYGISVLVGCFLAFLFNKPKMKPLFAFG